MIIGIGHRKQVGKDTLADFMIQHAKTSVKKRALADPLYETCRSLFGWAGFQSRMYYNTFPDEKEIPLTAIGKSPRQLLIDLGTKGIRENVWADTWVELLLNQRKSENVTIIPDVRFPNEFNAIRLHGGVLLKVVRPSHEITHDVADDALGEEKGWDKVIYNDGGLDDLAAQAKELAREFLYARTSL